MPLVGFEPAISTSEQPLGPGFYFNITRLEGALFLHSYCPEPIQTAELDINVPGGIPTRNLGASDR